MGLDGGVPLPPRMLLGGSLRTVVALHPEQHRAAEHLVRRRYAWRGYRASNDDFDQTTACEEARPVTLLAEDGDRLLGTLTVRPDSPHGLLVTGYYQPELAAACWRKKATVPKSSACAARVAVSANW